MYNKTIQVTLDELRETAEDCSREMEDNDPDLALYSSFIHVASTLLRHVGGSGDAGSSGELVPLPV
jgi:hypothetical protein